MKSKKIIFIIFLIFLTILSCFTISYGVSDSYIWTTSSGLVETVSDTETDLKLESGSSILIEQTSRFCTL